MAKRIQKEQVRQTTEDPQAEVMKGDVEAEEAQRAKLAQEAGAAVSELDDLLDEIDEVLESNAEDFVKNYVQMGGE